MNRSWLSAALAVLCLAFALPAVAAEYYVSPNGNDASGDGSQGRPWRTIQKAADLMWAGDTCHVMDGEYAEMVRPARSGAAGQSISFVAAGQSVELNGARQITGWTRHSGNIWRASVAWDFGELFVDRQRMVLARWPNLTSGDVYRPDFYQATADGGDTSIIDSVHLTQSSGSWNGAKIFLLAGLGWSAEQLDVTGYDPAQHRISFNRPHYDYYDVDQYSLYFLYDLLSLLDAPSEWFLDRAAHTVYVWLPDGGDPNGHLVEASGGSAGFDLTDRSYIRVAGFKLMSGDIRMLNAMGCRVEDVRHLYPATELSVSGSDNVITKSEIGYATYTGVRLAGTRNTLSSCHVHHCNSVGMYYSIVELGLWPSGGSQNSIVDCSLHDAGKDGVTIGLDLSGCLIEHNEIYNAGLIAKNAAGFSTYSTNGGGTVIRYNVVHDIWPKDTPQYGSIANGGAISLGGGSADFSVHHNVAYRIPGYSIRLTEASRNNLVYNNTAVRSGGGWGDVISSAPGGPGSGVDGTVVANNLAVILDDGWSWCINFAGAVPVYHHNGYYNLLHDDLLNNKGVEGTGVVGNPLFANAAGNDLSLLAGSPMIDKGVAIPGITDGYAGSAPDIGAYERGGSELPGPQYGLLPDSITVISPNGGERWMAGSNHDITWTSLGTVTSVRIEVSTNAGASYTTVIASTANDGSFAWTIPNTSSASCLVRVSDASNASVNDASDATFPLLAGFAEYYVSPSGNDASGDGSQGRPWRTIQKAADLMWAGDTCHVMDGEYAEMVRPARSGAAGQSISFVADGQSVELNGARPITGWTRHSGNIWRASVAWNFGELFVDRQRMVLARWPNLTSGDIYRPNFYQATANGGKTSIIDSAHLTQPSGYWSGAKIFMVPGLGWNADQRDVTGYDPVEHRITFSPAIGFSDYYDVDQYSLYFLYDLLSLLDAPSEWYLDRAAHTVYLWLPDGGDPSGHLVEASGGSAGFDLTDRSYIRVAGFKLMSGDIRMMNAMGCLVEGVRHLYPATELSVTGSDNVITKSEIAYASYTGVNLAGTRNTLSRCHIHHCDYFGARDDATAASYSLVELRGSQNTIADCSLHDTGRDGLLIEAYRGVSGCLIEHNEIYNTGLIAKDLGGIYTGLGSGGGTVIRYNIVHDIWPRQSLQYGTFALGNGIYLDNSSSDFAVHHNVVYRTAANAICLNQPSQNILVYNNTAVGSGGGWGDVIRSNSMTPELAGVDGTVVANNLAVMLDDRLGLGSPFGWCIEFDRKAPDYHHNGYYNLLRSNQLNNQGLEGTGVTGNPLFADVAGNDFSLRAGSPMIDKGVVIPEITDGYVGSAPDIGAYELGGSVKPGPRYTFVPDAITVVSPNGGESWMVGSSHDITWTSLGTIANVKIEYSTNAGASYATVIASTANDGSYVWTVPDTPSASCQVRVSDASNAAVNDVSNATFDLQIIRRVRAVRRG